MEMALLRQCLLDSCCNPVFGFLFVVFFFDFFVTGAEIVVLKLVTKTVGTGSNCVSATFLSASG